MSEGIVMIYTLLCCLFTGSFSSGFGSCSFAGFLGGFLHIAGGLGIGDFLWHFLGGYCSVSVGGEVEIFAQ